MKSSTLEMQRMLLLIRLKLVKYLKLIVTNMNFKKDFHEISDCLSDIKGWKEGQRLLRKDKNRMELHRD